MPGGYNTSFPPLLYATSHFAERINGCSAGEPRVSFRNGTKGNMTVCHTWEGCEANVTSCLSDAGGTTGLFARVLINDFDFVFVVSTFCETEYLVPHSNFGKTSAARTFVLAVLNNHTQTSALHFEELTLLKN